MSANSYPVCPYCRAPRKTYNATCTRSQCQEADYYACMLGSTKDGTRKHKLLEAKAVETARAAADHPGWGLPQTEWSRS